MRYCGTLREAAVPPPRCPPLSLTSPPLVCPLVGVAGTLALQSRRDAGPPDKQTIQIQSFILGYI